MYYYKKYLKYKNKYLNLKGGAINSLKIKTEEISKIETEEEISKIKTEE
jgi:hypothetical protein